MEVPDFGLPAQGPADDAFLRGLPQFMEWLHQAPLTSADETGARVAKCIATSNRQSMPLAGRMALLEAAFPYARRICALLSQRRLAGRSFAGERFRAVSALEAQLQNEFACGYMAVVQDGLSGEPPGGGHTLLPTALARAAFLLACLVANAYAAYQKEPAKCWEGMHRLYRIATELDCTETACPDSGPSADTGLAADYVSVASAYKAALLLAIADPYRFTEGEVGMVFKWLATWADDCRVEEAPADLPLGGRFLVEPDSDRGPVYLTRQGDASRDRVWLVDASGVARRAAVAARDLIAAHLERSGVENLPFQARIQRNLLLRLHEAWSGRKERHHPRSPLEATVELAADFRTVHHYLTGGEPFNPELAELTICKIEYGDKSIGQKWSLVPEDHEPWRVNVEASDLELNAGLNRQSAFDSDHQAIDTWSQVYATKARPPSRDTVHPLKTWAVINMSAGGLALQLSGQEDPGTRVGGLVIFRRRGRADPGAWYVATVQWMTRFEMLRIGIRVLAPHAQAVAVRAVQGTGTGSEYMRALLPEGRRGGAAGFRLIAPAAVYDVRTMVAINDGASIGYARLNRVVETTRSYTEFECASEPTPEPERKKLEELKSHFRTAR